MGSSSKKEDKHEKRDAEGGKEKQKKQKKKSKSSSSSKRKEKRRRDEEEEAEGEEEKAAGLEHHSKRHKHKHKKDKKKDKKKDERKDKKRVKHGLEPSSLPPSLPPSSLSSTLRTLLLYHPAMVKEVLLVLGALEDGQGVALDGLPSVETRRRMGALLESLGLRSELQGLSASTTYFLSEAQEKENDPLLSATLQAIDGILGPLPPATLAAHSALASLFAAYPVLEAAGEIEGLLLRLLVGESVVLAGLEEEKLRTALEAVFLALGLEMRSPSEDAEGEEGYALPPLVEGGEGRRGRGRTEVKEAIVELSRLMRKDGRVDQEIRKILAEEAGRREEEAATAAAAGGGGGAGAPGTASEGGSEGGREGGREGGQEKRPMVKGPAMPDAAMLAQAEELMKKAPLPGEGGGEEDDYHSDSSGDVIGPTMGDGREAVPDEIAFRHIRAQRAAAAAATAHGKAGGEGGREEWMNLAPSELMAGSVSNLERLRKDVMTSQKHRGFTQRSERQRVTNPTGPKAPRNAAEARLLKEEEAQAATTKSLLEKHQEKVKKAQAKEKERQKKEGVTRTPWSREAFMEGTKKVGQKEASQLFAQAQELSGRFSRQFR